MGLQNRLELYAKIEEHRKRPLLVYVTSKREGVTASMATDALPYLIDQLDKLPPDTTELDFLLVSFGGDPMVAWRIMSLIRQRVDKVSVLIPQSAYSAATLLALGADEIVMHPNGHLGPVDMQITTFSEGRPKQFSTEDISAFLTFVRESLAITDQKHLRALFEVTCKEIGSLGVGFTARNSKLAVALGERMLAMHGPQNEQGSAAHRTAVESLSRQFHSHAYPVSRKEAMSLELAVNKEQDKTLEALMWEVWLELEEELKEREPFHPLVELLRSEEASKLLAKVPQLNLPLHAIGTSHCQTSPADVMAQTVYVEPVDFEIIDAIMESPRLAHRGITRGKIIAFRQPDLNVQYNLLVTFRGWVKQHPGATP